MWIKTRGMRTARGVGLVELCDQSGDNEQLQVRPEVVDDLTVPQPHALVGTLEGDHSQGFCFTVQVDLDGHDGQDEDDEADDADGLTASPDRGRPAGEVDELQVGCPYNSEEGETEDAIDENHLALDEAEVVATDETGLALLGGQNVEQLGPVYGVDDAEEQVEYGHGSQEDESVLNCTDEVDVCPVLLVDNGGSLVVVWLGVDGSLDGGPCFCGQPGHELDEVHATDGQLEGSGEPG